MTPETTAEIERLRGMWFDEHTERVRLDERLKMANNTIADLREQLAVLHPSEQYDTAPSLELSDTEQAQIDEMIEGIAHWLSFPQAEIDLLERATAHWPMYNPFLAQMAISRARAIDAEARKA